MPEWLSDSFESLTSGGFSPQNLERLYQAYYDFAVRTVSSRFLRAYLIFERDLRNILSAFRARRKGLPPSEHLVGEGDLVELLSRSSGDDFGVSRDYPFADRILEAKSPQDVEETVQQIMWETIETLIEPEDFEFDVVLAYLAKLQILERNLALSQDQGLDIVRRLEEQ